MKEELLEELREKLNEKRKERDSKKIMCKELEENDFVKQYMELRGIAKASQEEFDFDEKKFVINQFFWTILKDKTDTNEMYRHNPYGLFQPSENDKSKTDYYETYTNIETGETVIIKEDECEEFERKHIILSSEKGYYSMQQEFVMTAVNTTQKEAVIRLCEKYGKRK